MIYLSYDSGNPMENQASFRMDFMIWIKIEIKGYAWIWKKIVSETFLGNPGNL